LSFLQAISALRKQDHAKRQVLKSMAQLMGYRHSLAMPAANIRATIAQSVDQATNDSIRQRPS
jgi:hypothetical protein